MIWLIVPAWGCGLSVTWSKESQLCDWTRSTKSYPSSVTEWLLCQQSRSMRTGKVFFSDQEAGLLEELEHGYRFTYLPSYLADPKALPVSLLLPLREEAYDEKRLFPFFDGLIPEGWLLEIAEDSWKLNPRDRMGLLLACCRDCIGAVGVVPTSTSEDHE
jgi:serine/threonine-protein kinase HipA